MPITINTGIKAKDKDGNWVNGIAIPIGIDDKTTPQYISNGLIGLYDGIKNTENGHSNDTKIWKNLVGENDLPLNFTGTKILKDSILKVDNNSKIVTSRNDWSRSIKCLEVVCFVSPIARVIATLNGNGQMITQVANGLCFANGGKQYPIEFSNKFVTITCNFTSQKFYLNGVELLPSETTSSWMNSDSYGLNMGYYNGSSYTYFGNYHSIRCYNRELTEEEILFNHNIDKERF